MYAAWRPLGRRQHTNRAKAPVAWFLNFCKFAFNHLSNRSLSSRQFPNTFRLSLGELGATKLFCPQAN